MIPTLYLAAGIAAASLLIGGAAGYAARGVIADRDLAATKATYDSERAKAADASRVAETAARREEQRRTVALQEISDAASIRALHRADASRAADVAGNGLRVQAASFAASASAAAGDSEVAGDCKAAGDAARVLAELLGRVEEAGRRMAAVADERGDAGQACERAADALTP